MHLKKTLYLSFLLLLTSCQNPLSQGTPMFIEKLEIIAENNANNNSPVAVDIVASYNKSLTERLISISARTYFQQKKQLERDFPNTIYTKGWEIPPGMSANEVVMHDPQMVSGMFIFADYLTPGDHRARLEPDEYVKVILQEKDMVIKSVTPLEEKDKENA